MAEYLVTNGNALNLEHLGTVELTVDQAKSRCIVHFNSGNTCYMDSGNCDLREDGRCHRGTPTIIVRPEDKLTPITYQIHSK